MARRIVKLISVVLTLTVLVNSAYEGLATFSDKFLFVVSLLSLVFTLLQIAVSVTSWVIGKKLNRNVKQYVGNVMSNYIATARVRPLADRSGKNKGTVGDKLGKAKDRFLRTIETLTLPGDDSLHRDLEDDAIDTNDITDRFENDYQSQAGVEDDDNTVSKKNKHSVKKDRRSSFAKREKPSDAPKKIKLSIFARSQDGEVASDVVQEDDKETNEPIT